MANPRGKAGNAEVEEEEEVTTDHKIRLTHLENISFNITTNILLFVKPVTSNHSEAHERFCVVVDIVVVVVLMMIMMMMVMVAVVVVAVMMMIIIICRISPSVLMPVTVF